MERTRRRVPALVGLVALTGALLVALAGPAPAMHSHEVDVRDNRFEPRTLYVRPGTEVTWTQSGTNPHTVTSDQGAGETFDSGLMQQGDDFEHPFNVEGEFDYHCNVHNNMTGTIVVTDDDPELTVNDRLVQRPDSGAVPLQFRVDLTYDSDETVTVDYEITPGTAVEGVDYEADDPLSGTLTYDPGETRQTVTISVLADPDAEEGDVTLFLDLSNASNADILTSQATGTIRTGTLEWPTADAGGPYTVDEGQPVTFVGSGSTAPAGRTIEEYAWDVTGDATPDLFGETVEHVFAEDGSYTVRLTVTDSEGLSDSDSATVTVRDIGIVGRAAGDDRVATAVAVSSRFWGSASEVLLATARNFPDALAAGPLAAALDAPLLLTEPEALPGSVATELQRLGATTVTILGGPAAVSDAVTADLQARGYTVRRIEGANRFGTARAVAGEVGASATREVVVALGQHADPTRDSWPDALSAGALSASPDRLPILLTGSDEVPPDTEAALAELDTARVFLLGGTAAISTAVADHLAGLGYEVRRLEGVNRFATSVAVASEALTRHPAGDVRLVFATGSNFPDGLTAGALGARVAGLVVLVPTDDLAEVVRAFLDQHARRFDHGTVVGGPAVVTEMVRGQLQDAMTAS